MVGITVNPVNDVPVLTVPGTQTTAEDVAGNIIGLAVADVDVSEGTGAMKVILSVGSGNLTVAADIAGGLTASQITGNGSAVIVLQGPVFAVNGTLAAGITYLGNLNFNGTDTLTILGDDLGNTGAGGTLTDSETVSIRVLSPTGQIAALDDATRALYAEADINQGQANSLLKRPENAQAALNLCKSKLAAFRNQISSLIADGVLTPAQGEPLLSAAQSLLQSLGIGGGF
jgi:hypothetical protein